MSAETKKDMADVVAWAMVIADVIQVLPHEMRAAVLERAVADEKAAAARPMVMSAGDLMNDPLMREQQGHRNAELRLKSLVVQLLVRGITNNTSRENARAILRAQHPYGHGSGRLEDYLAGVL